MRSTFFVLAVVCALWAAGARAEGDVIDLTTDTFDKVIKENEFVLVEFFAPWCGHCKRLAPEYAKAATALKGDGVVLAAVDATIERDLASKFGVRGYPTLKVFRNGEAQEYKGGRTEETIISYMRKLSGPPARTLDSASDVEAFIESSKVVIVGYFKDLSGSEYDAFIKTAAADDDNVYGVTASATDDTSAPGIVLYKKFDEGKNVFDGEFTPTAIKQFVQTNRVPTVIPFTMEAAGDIFQSPVGKVVFLFTDDEAPAWYSELAKENKGKFVFSTSDSSQSRLTSYIGVTKADFPVLYILETGSQMKKFPLAGAPSASSARSHVQSYLAGDLKPTFKSAEPPASNDGPVKVVVGKSFESIVLDESKNVLLEVYAPWCGHCKKLEPIYEQLGQAFADADDVVIAKMDGTENEVDGLGVRGYPTIKFYPKGKKTNDGEAYNGGRELKDLVKFLTERTGAKAVHDEL